MGKSWVYWLTCVVLQEEESVEAARGLITEVYELVADNYLDARRGGFDPHRWELYTALLTSPSA